ncbi:uncharacterized protein FTOL_06452 [Fusarium torulosum]|uniref:Uncharacterized protein n=1 Tax=Fusarium torulosum TaxID=33205 RepID=A0AAE8M9W0_9HYPO|nr:uncharacterized protein FTOL_06452 [Fusarium torulosum]
MSLSSIQAKWKINKSDQELLAKQVLVVAARDNVQAVALIACQQFGSTIYICDETTSKVATDIVATPQPDTILFLKASVGYRSFDSTTWLGESVEGLRFLGLAAALIPSLDLIDGAKVLNTMLRSSASDQMLLPTVRQLKDLLGSLQPRSYRARFSDSVVEWQIKLQKEALPHICVDEGRSGDSSSFLFRSAPSPEMVAELVHIFRQASKGDFTFTGVTIKAGAAAAWVAAFIEWCSGLPPSIYMEDNQELLEQPDSLIRLVVPKTLKGLQEGLGINVHDSLGHPDESFVAPASSTSFSGMATIENYGKWLLESFGLKGASLEALHEALNYAIPQAVAKLKWVEFDVSTEGSYYDKKGPSVDDYTLHPLPHTSEIADVYSKLLSLANTPRFARLDRHMLIADSPLVSRYLESLRKTCPCSQCCREMLLRADIRESPCRQDKFFEFISFITIDILVLSLFRSPDVLLVKLSDKRNGSDSLKDALFHLIRDGVPEYTKDEPTYTISLLAWARAMVGHKASVEGEDSNTVATSGYGQVIYPTLFDTLDIKRQGYLGLTSHQGVLIYEGEIYRTVTADEGGSAQHELLSLDLSYPKPTSVPLNAFPDLTVFWKVSEQDNGELSVALSVRSRTDSLLSVRKNPIDLLRILGKCLLIEQCPHDGYRETAYKSTFFSHKGPLDTHQEACDTAYDVDVIPVSDASDLRCFSLTCTREQAILRKNACMDCCLRACIDIGIHVLIL